MMLAVDVARNQAVARHSRESYRHRGSSHRLGHARRLLASSSQRRVLGLVFGSIVNSHARSATGNKTTQKQNKHKKQIYERNKNIIHRYLICNREHWYPNSPPMAGSSLLFETMHHFRSIHDQMFWLAPKAHSRWVSGLSGRSLGSLG